MREINHLSLQQWLRSAIPDSQQPTSPIGFLFLKLPPPPCAVLLVSYYQYIYIYIFMYYNQCTNILWYTSHLFENCCTSWYAMYVCMSLYFVAVHQSISNHLLEYMGWFIKLYQPLCSKSLDFRPIPANLRLIVGSHALSQRAPREIDSRNIYRKAGFENYQKLLFVLKVFILHLFP